MNFRVYSSVTTRDGGLTVSRNCYFRTEREARSYINARANGCATFSLYAVVNMADLWADELIPI